MDLNPKKHPTLSAFISQGKVWWDDELLSFIGSTNSGEQVTLGFGCSGPDLAQHESYLKAHPTPDTW